MKKKIGQNVIEGNMEWVHVSSSTKEETARILPKRLVYRFLQYKVILLFKVVLKMFFHLNKTNYSYSFYELVAAVCTF